MSAPPATTGLVTAMLLDGNGGGELLDWNGVARWRPEDGLLWIDVDYAAPDVQRWLGLESGIDRHTREALVASDPRPRAELRGDALVLIVRGVNVTRGAEPEDMVSTRAWLGERRVITLRHRAVNALTILAERIGAGDGPRDAGDFTALLVDEILAPVSELVDDLGDRVASLEDAALGDDLTAPRARIADLRRSAIALRRFIGPQRDALGRLAAIGVPWLTEHHRSQLRDAADRQTRTVEELDAARDRAAVTHEELVARVDELANRRLYVLSLVTALFLPLSFVTGLLGVNVGGIPARDVDWAFWALCGVFVVMAAGQYVLLRRLRWF